MPRHVADGMTGLPEKELDVSLNLAEQVVDLKRRILHLETLEGRGGDLVALDKVELTAPAASVTFAGIEATYAALRLLIAVRTDRVATTDEIELTFNNDVTGYDYITRFIGHSGVLTTTQALNSNFIQVLAMGDATGGVPAYALLDLMILNYTSTVHQKGVIVNGVRKLSNTSGNVHEIGGSGWWRSNSVISEIDIVPTVGPNFLSGSNFYLYGMNESP